jgi:hypothetical protein
MMTIQAHEALDALLTVCQNDAEDIHLAVTPS